MKKLKILVFFLFIGSPLLQAQELDYTATIDTPMVLIGDQSKLTLDLSFPQDVKVTLPVLSDTIVGKVEILSQTPFDTVSTANGYYQLRKELVITSFDSNLYFIPPFELTYVNYDNREDLVVSNALSFQVLTIPIPEEQGNRLIDIKKIKETPFNWNEFWYYVKKYFPYILSILLLIGLVVFVVLYFERKKAGQLPKLPPKPKEPADVIALRQLEALTRANYVQKGLLKEYHSQVSEIVRRYLENRYEILALEETSSWILDQVSQAKLMSLENLVKLKDLLHVSDLVKFAKYEANDYENETILKSAYELVESTKLTKQETSPEAPKIA